MAPVIVKEHTSYANVEEARVIHTDLGARAAAEARHPSYKSSLPFSSVTNLTPE